MAPSKCAVLFDLDETLVLTSKIEPLRKLRDWPKVYVSFSQTELPPGTLNFIARVKALADVQIGVVTKSPRTYAERLLKYHGIPIPVLIAYHDVQRHKPHPNALIKAAERLKLPPARCVYVGDHPDDIAAAGAANCMSIAVCWAGNSDLRDVCDSWDAVYERVMLIFGRLNG
jgi:HAD superfamily hydrolase (TIGR01549 family)